MLLEKHVLKHKKVRKNLEGKEKVYNFALAFENEAAQRRGRRESEPAGLRMLKAVKAAIKICTIRKLVLTLHPLFG